MDGASRSKQITQGDRDRKAGKALDQINSRGSLRASLSRYRSVVAVLTSPGFVHLTSPFHSARTAPGREISPDRHIG